MRIISQDGTRDFPYEQIALVIRNRLYNVNDEMTNVYVIVAIYCDKEYDMALYHDMDDAICVLEDVRNSLFNIYEEYDEDVELADIDIQYIVLPKEDELYE